MQTRRDQVQAHRFVVGRLTTGMLRAEPDIPEPPTGRTTQGMVIGLVIAVIIGVGAVVLGALAGRGGSWRTEGALVAEKETGARFLYMGGTLRPLQNYTSARLLTGREPQLKRMPRKSLEKIPRGAPVGIPGAPDALPPATKLTDAAWQVCAADGRTVLDAAAATTAPALGDGRAVLVEGPGRARHLLWQGRRLKLGGSGVAAALGYGATTPYKVSAAFLNAVPVGPDLAAPEVPDRGERVSGKRDRIGQLYVVHVAGSADQYFQLRREGVTPLTATLFNLYKADPGVSGKPLTPTTVDDPAPPLAAEGLPATPPAAAPASAARPCVRFRPGPHASPAETVLAPPAEVGGQPVVTRPNVSPACTTPDLIGTRPGHAVLAAALPAAGRPRVATRYLVTDEGVRYPVPTEQSATALGYGGGVMLPAAVLDLLPTGPTLDAASVRSGVPAAPVPTCAGTP